MQRRTVTVILLLVLGALAFAAYTFLPRELPGFGSGSEPTGIPADARPATVAYVHDGDTLFIDDEGAELKVRLLGVDTPEIGDNLECYGTQARDALRALLPEGTKVWTVEDREPFDRYGRSLLYLYTADPASDDATMVNLALVEQGAAEAIRVGRNDAHWDELQAAERSARDAGLGLWGQC